MAETLAPDAASPDAAAASGATDTAPTGATEPGAYAGWAALQQAVNAGLVRDLQQAAKVRRAALRVLAGG